MWRTRLLSLLQKNNLTLSVAESCTGGLISASICEISGISAHFEEGYVTYSERAKEKNLGVSAETLMRHGVVSEETAREMATGCKNCSGADCAVSVTGIAGPGGGTKKDPVGTVCFGWAIGEEVLTERKFFSGDRQEVRRQAADYALERLCDEIESRNKE